MKNIKNFENFINEELSPETYMSAANKLGNMGHYKRANKLKYHAKDDTDLILPIKLNNEEYLISIDDINLTLIKDDGSEESEGDYLIIDIKNNSLSLTYYIDDNITLFYLNGEDIDNGLDDRKSANNLNKLIKNKVKKEFDSSSRSERRLYYKVLNQLTPNLFYKD